MGFYWVILSQPRPIFHGQMGPVVYRLESIRPAIDDALLNGPTKVSKMYTFKAQIHFIMSHMKYFGPFI